MKNVKTAEMNENRVLLVAFLVAMLIGHVITFNDFRLFGVVITIQRLTVFFLIAAALYLTFIVRKNLFRDRNQYRILSVFTLWMFWGLATLLSNPVSSNKAGILELLNIFIGGIFILALYTRISEKEDLDLVYLTLKFIGVIFLLFAFYEITTRYHLPVSRLKPGRKFIAATGIFYNENDFSTALALLVPFYLSAFRRNYFEKVTGILLVLMSYYIMYINDAWIVLAFVTFGLLSQMWMRGNRKLIYGLVMAGVIFIIIYRISTGNGFSVLEAQIASMREGTGSLYNRLVTYKNSLVVSKETHFLGLGPKGFSTYMENQPLDGLLNPHNLWLEILSQYGLLILVVHIGFILRNFTFLYRKYRETKDERILVPLTIYIIYVGVSISSSSFLASIYQWLPLAIGYAAEHYLISHENSEKLMFHRFKEQK